MTNKFKMMYNKTKSLKWQLLFRCLLLLVILLAVMEIAQYVSTKQYLFKDKEQILKSSLRNIEVSELTRINTDELVKQNAEQIVKKMMDFDVVATVIDKDGNVVASGTKNYEHSDYPKLSAEEYKQIINSKGKIEKYKPVDNEEGKEYIVVWSKLGSNSSSVGLIQLSTSGESVEKLLSLHFLQNIIGSIIILILGIILGRPILNHTLKPLYEMTETVENINVGMLNTRLSEESEQIEIDSLSKAFNGMLERIEMSFEKEQELKEKMRRFVSDASHELRTPLTSIHGFVEVLLRGAAKNEQQLDRALNSILMESERLTKLVNDLLLLTRLDQNIVTEMKKENLKNIINEILPQLEIIKRNRSINIEGTKDVSIMCDKNQIKQIIFNLVQNAIQHTSEETGEITISTDSQVVDGKQQGVLIIGDNGSGISEYDLEKIFDRFFRSEFDRSRKQGGYGLGLSIVKSIVDAHQAKITVESKVGEGTKYNIVFSK